MTFQLRHNRSDEFISFIEINSFEQLKNMFQNNEIVINFDEQTIWVKSRNNSFSLEV